MIAYRVLVYSMFILYCLAEYGPEPFGGVGLLPIMLLVVFAVADYREFTES